MTFTEPKSTNDMVFADSTTENQIDAILSGAYPFPSSGKSALCLFGTYGTGKTTYSHIFCDEFEYARSGKKQAIQPHFVSCQKTEAIDTILKTCERMTKVISFNESGYHYFIFDEVDNLTAGAQKALKAFLNKPNIVCILTTNYLDELDNGLVNRCISVNFNAADPKEIRARVQCILRDMGLAPLENEKIDEVIQSSDGSWRDIVPTVTFLAKQLSKPPNKPLRIVK